MAQNVKTASDYLYGLQRRKWLCLGIAFSLIMISTAIALGWPPTYRSTATILIEQQEIPEKLVQSTVTSYADQRIQTISQRVMSRANLLSIIRKYGLYTDELKDQPIEVVIDKMRKDVNLDMVSADVVDPRSGRPVEATIAFKLSYENRSPVLAQKVTNELTSLYLDEDLKRRTELATETSDFMTDEANRLEAKIARLEGNLAEFKQKNAGMIPDLKDLNLQIRDRTEASIQEVERRIRDLNDRIIFLTSELDQAGSAVTTTDPSQVVDPVVRLKMLQTKQISMKAIYGPEHPSVVRLRREIAALQKQVGKTGQSMPDMKHRLASQEVELHTDEGKYSTDHPEIKRLKKSIAGLKAAIKTAGKQSSDADSNLVDSENPTYIQVRTQLESAKAELRSLKSSKADLTKKLDKYEGYLAGMPEVERRYRALSRDYANAMAQYREIKAKQMDAQMAQSLETERKGERFTLIDPPQLPEKPVKPNRLAIGVLGLLFSVAGGVGTGVMLENMDQRVRGYEGVHGLGIPLLGPVPYIETVRERIRRRRLWISLSFGAVAMVSMALVLVHLLYMPLDVLWFSLSRRLGA